MLEDLLQKLESSDHGMEFVHVCGFLGLFAYRKYGDEFLKEAIEYVKKEIEKRQRD